MQAASGLKVLARRLTGGVSRLPAAATQQVRRMSTELRPREQKLLEEDPALKNFKSEKGKVEFIKRLGDVLVIAVVAGSVYEIYYRVMARRAAQAEKSTNEA